MYFMPEWYTYVIPIVYNRGLDKCPQGIVPLHAGMEHAALELFFGNILRIDDYPRLSLLGVGGYPPMSISSVLMVTREEKVSIRSWTIPNRAGKILGSGELRLTLSFHQAWKETGQPPIQLAPAPRSPAFLSRQNFSIPCLSYQK